MLNAPEAEMKGRIGALRQNLKPVRAVFEGSVTSSSGPPHHLFPHPVTAMLSGIEFFPFCFRLYPLLPNSPGSKSNQKGSAFQKNGQVPLEVCVSYLPASLTKMDPLGVKKDRCWFWITVWSFRCVTIRLGCFGMRWTQQQQHTVEPNHSTQGQRQRRHTVQEPSTVT